MPTKKPIIPPKAPAGKPRRYTQREIDAINKAAPEKMEKLNKDSMMRTEIKRLSHEQRLRQKEEMRRKMT